MFCPPETKESDPIASQPSVPILQSRAFPIPNPINMYMPCLTTYLHKHTRDDTIFLLPGGTVQHNQTNKPSSCKRLSSPPAARTARIAASLILRRRSLASFSRRALVFDDPLGATPVRIFLLSCGVKLTKSTSDAPPPPSFLGVGVPGEACLCARLGTRRLRAL